MLFTVPFYHFLFSRYLDLTKRHFLSDILVPFPDWRNFCSCVLSLSLSSTFLLGFLLLPFFACVLLYSPYSSLYAFVHLRVFIFIIIIIIIVIIIIIIIIIIISSCSFFLYFQPCIFLTFFFLFYFSYLLFFFHSLYLPCANPKL